MTDVKITAVADGPYKVEGGVEIEGPTGDDCSQERDTVYLCRCGESSNKPFCDGTHSKVGFEASEPCEGS